MRILHIILSFNTGGSETMLVDIANQQVKLGHQVGVMIVNDSITPSLLSSLNKEVKVILNKRTPGSRNPFNLVKMNLSILRFRPDFIHTHSSSLPKMIPSIISRKLWYTVHALQIVPQCVGRLNMIAISKAVHDDIISRYPNARIKTISNGIDVDAIKVRETSSIKGMLKIVQVARLDYEKKGQDLLIKAVSELKKRGYSQFDVSFIGWGEEEAYLNSMAKEFDVENQIHFLGIRNREYIYSHLADYDLMCHPSRYEGFGLTIAEGACAGLPLLVSDDGGPFEIIEKGKLGYSFKLGDHLALADDLLEIYNNYNQALELAAKARESVKEKYSVKRMVEEYIDYYKANK